MSDKVYELLIRTKAMVGYANDRMSLWHAYVATEYAILDLKLRYGLEGEPPPKPAKKADLATIKSMLEHIDPSSQDKKKLLYDLRACRDLLKALVAGYGRRSTTS
jgi:hypothetical protein